MKRQDVINALQDQVVNPHPPLGGQDLQRLKPLWLEA